MSFEKPGLILKTKSQTEHVKTRAAANLPQYVICCLGTILFTILTETNTPAQYIVHQWINFEQGVVPPQMTNLGLRGQQNVPQAVNLNQAATIWPSVRHPQTWGETGGFVLAVGSEKKDLYLNGLGTPVVLQRQLIGPRGRALFQADFFLPPEGERAPSLAVLAMSPLKPGETNPSKFYRFGIGGNRRIYFSTVFAASGPAKVYKQDKKLFEQLPRNMWHRFAIVFEGRELIRCYVDGIEASFSPIRDTNIENLQLGLLLAEANQQYTAFADNLSIQYALENYPPPDSPYAASWGSMAPAPSDQQTFFEALNVAAASGAGPSAVTPPSTGGAGSINWVQPHEATALATSQGKNILVYFHAPRLKLTAALNGEMLRQPAAQGLLGRHVAVHIDVNQLGGGTWASQYGVFRVPTILIINPAGQEVARSTWERGSTWESFASKLIY